MKKTIIALSLLAVNGAMAADLPDFLDQSEIDNAQFKCLGEPVTYSKTDQKYVNMLWNETLTYLKAYAIALTNGENSHYLNSDVAMIDSTRGGQKMCIMDRRDMQLMVKNIYQVINNADKAKQCFGVREDVNWIYNPGGELTKNSPVAQHFKRTTFDEFFMTKVTNKEVQKLGKTFTNNFYKMVTGDEVKMPSVFPYDISANALPNLWAAAGWFYVCRGE